MTQTETEMTQKGYYIANTWDTRADAVEDADTIRRCANGANVDIRKCTGGWNVWVEKGEQ